MRRSRLCLAVVALLGMHATAAEGETVEAPACTLQVIGFSGGHIIPEFIVISRFQEIARALHDVGRSGICVRTFPGILGPLAFRWARRSFGPDDRRLTPVEIAAGPAIIIYGFSSGGWSALHLARHLGDDGIPVELLVQIDTPWFTRSVVPRNVRVSANFYERRTWFPLLWGTARARAEDATTTDFLGNIRLARVGHFGIPKRPEIRDLVVTTARRVSSSSPTIEGPSPAQARLTGRPRELLATLAADLAR